MNTTFGEIVARKNNDRVKHTNNRYLMLHKRFRGVYQRDTNHEMNVIKYEWEHLAAYSCPLPRALRSWFLQLVLFLSVLCVLDEWTENLFANIYKAARRRVERKTNTITWCVWRKTFEIKCDEIDRKNTIWNMQSHTIINGNWEMLDCLISNKRMNRAWKILLCQVSIRFWNSFEAHDITVRAPISWTKNVKHMFQLMCTIVICNGSSTEF